MATTVKYFNTAGASTWIAPPGVTGAQIEGWGAGGAGARRTTNGQGGGGGGGAYSKLNNFTPTAGTTYNTSVGAGGLGNGAGTAGGNTTFNGTTLKAVGGSASLSNNATGGAGGLANASTGDVTSSGGTGATGNATIFGGGGGAAGQNNGGAGANGSGNNGGTGANGGGSGGAGSKNGSAIGTIGSSPGGGGGGASRNSTTNRVGGNGAVGRLIITYTTPLASALTDNFDDGSINAAKFYTYISGAGSVTESGGKIALVPPASVGSGEAMLLSNENYDLTGVSCFVNVLQVSTLTGAENLFMLAVNGDGANRLEMSVLDDNKLHAIKNVGGSKSSLADVAFNITTMAWWRIRESGGTTYWEYTDNAGIIANSWTTLWSEANPLAVTSLQLRLDYYLGSSQASPGATWFDNINLTPPPITVLNTPANAGTVASVTPVLNFTGTDAEAQDVEYEAQIDEANTFDSSGTIDNALSLTNNGALYTSPAVSTDFSDISFFCWVKIATKNQYNIIFMNGLGGSAGQGYQFAVDNDAAGNVLRLDISYVAGLDSTLTITDSNWHFVGFTRRASDGVWTIYLDGTSDEVGTSDPYGNDGSSRTVIGGDNVDTTITPSFSGLMARVGYWDSLLSSANIVSLYGGALVSTISTGLVIDLPLNNSGVWGTNGGSGGNFSTNGTLTLSSNGFDFITAPLVDALSTDQTGFSGGASHPYTSGDAVEYTIQGGDSLTDAVTYYWRVRAKDPSGTNAWGAWSTIRSFTVTSGTAANSERSAKITGKASTSSERSAKIRGKLTSNAERSVKITGKASANSARSAKVTGVATTASERSVKITGKLTSNSERNVKITGKAGANSERNVKITGKLTSNSERPAKVTGKQSASSDRPVKITGVATTSSVRDAKITGKNTSSSERSVKIIGKASTSSERDTKIIGKSSSYSERSAKIEGVSAFDLANSERSAKITGQASANSERLVKITGKLGTSSERPAKIAGKIITSDNRLVKIAGVASTASERSAKVVGKSTAQDSRNAKVTGVATSYSERASKIAGQSSSSSDRPAKVIGKADTSSARGASIAGVDQASSDRLASVQGQNTAFFEVFSKIWGKISDFSERLAKITGIHVSSDERDVKIKGKDTASSERLVKVTGQISTSSERSAKIMGRAILPTKKLSLISRVGSGAISILMQKVGLKQKPGKVILTNRQRRSVILK